MTDLHIRPARLDDTAAISALFRAQIDVWQRFDERGQVQDLPYEALSVYERWLHGGPWMSLETGAIFLAHLLRGAAVPLIVETDGKICGYGEVYAGNEPAPYGIHIHLGSVTARHEDETAIKQTLITHLVENAPHYGGQRLTVSISNYDQTAVALYEACGLKPIGEIARYTVPAHTGQSFYRATEQLSTDPSQIKGWSMCVGRLESGRYHWETQWPRLWDVIPQIAHRQTHRLHFSASGQEAMVYFQQHLYDPRSADVSCWSPKPMGSHLLTAIRDWAHRQSYRTLVLAVPEATARILPQEIEEMHHKQIIYAS